MKCTRSEDIALCLVTRKKKIPSKREARDIVRKTWWMRRTRLRSYRCIYCECYHVGNQFQWGSMR